MLHSELKTMMGHTETQAFFTFIDECYQTNAVDAIPGLLSNKLPELLNHELAACGIGNPASGHINYYINQNYPREYETSVIDRHNVINSPVFLSWSRSKRPQIFDERNLEKRSDSIWVERFYQHDLRNIAAHGLADISGNMTSYFTFSRIPPQSTRRSLALLDILIPHMHIAFSRAVANERTRKNKENVERSQLSRREVEVVKWVYAGKSNQEIADKLKISFNTVKNHLHNIGIKLNARNRAHIVAKALESGLIAMH